MTRNEEILALGRLPAADGPIFRCPEGFRVSVYLSYANVSTATTVNCSIHAAQREAEFPTAGGTALRIGASTDLAAKATIEVPGDGRAMRLGPGDEIWGYSPGTVDFVIDGGWKKVGT